MKLGINTVFANHYRLIRELGSGGFSVVWLANDEQTDLDVALKIYAPGAGLDEDGIRIFKKEFRDFFNLNHSNLLKAAHYDICERMPYLVLPFCERGSAAKMIENISEDEAWNFLHDVAAGLAYLHEQDPPVIHQDIKPANILADSQGKFLITDFGISAKARNTLRKSAMSNNQTSGGTLAYMSPESFDTNNTPIKARDIWALGSTLFEMLTGDVPFPGDGLYFAGGLVQKSGAEIPNIKASLSKDLKTVITRCLHKEPWHRPTAKQIVEWTEMHFKGKQVPPNPVMKRIKIAGSAVAVLLVILAVVFLLPKTPPDDSKEKEFAIHVQLGDKFFNQGEDYYRQADEEYQHARELSSQHKIKNTMDIETKWRVLDGKIDSLVKNYKEQSRGFININRPEMDVVAIQLLEQALKLKDNAEITKQIKDLKIKKYNN